MFGKLLFFFVFPKLGISYKGTNANALPKKGIVRAYTGMQTFIATKTIKTQAAQIVIVVEIIFFIFSLLLLILLGNC